VAPLGGTVERHRPPQWGDAPTALRYPRLVQRLLWPLVACLTLGLAPFVPEPHLVGKLRWVAGGAVGMQPMDWLDLAMHGAPFVWLAVAAVRVARDRVRDHSSS
jgi:hypothetical protein